MAGLPLTPSQALDRAIQACNAGDLAAGETICQQILAGDPQDFGALHLIADIQGALGRSDEALGNYNRAIAIRPDYPQAFNNRGALLHRMGRPEAALSSFDQALALRSDYPDAHYNRANVLAELGRLGEALASYDQALAFRPDLVEALYNRGNVLRDLGRPEDALASYDRAVALRPGHPQALYNRGVTLQAAGRLREALASFEACLAVARDHPHAFRGAAECVLRLCDWERRAIYTAALPACVRNETTVVTPFLALGYSGDPALQLPSAIKVLKDRFPQLPAPVSPRPAPKGDRIRIAYLSADFHAHATAYLIAGLIEQHDRARFEVIGVSFGADDASPIRARLRRAFDAFHDVAALDDQAAAQRLADLNIDVAIDLKGYTGGARPGILARRPAPVQVSFLGFPSTMGAPFIDYIIADSVVLPFADQPYFSEAIVHLPGSYQVNDSRRPIAGQAPARASEGLPDEGFVFCAFNGLWKIAPVVFDVWMRLLQKTPGSVLWLLADNDPAQDSLREQARKRGVDPSRLVFASQLPQAEHLARHRLADLFLDTLPCNAHTSASDALWAGLPVVTCPGKTFAGRVAASVLHAVGLADLVAPSLAAYESLALKLARDPDALAEVKARLARNRETAPLFDTAAFARHIEAAYVEMTARRQRGHAPAAFAVEGT